MEYLWGVASVLLAEGIILCFATGWLRGKMNEN